MNILFFGSSKFAIPILEKLILNKQFFVSAIVTQADKPAGRKQKLKPTFVKKWLSKNYPNIQIYQPQILKNQANTILKIQNPDLIITAAYGQILPKQIINFPEKKAINIHASLLPKYRGAVPIETALLNGDKITGVSIIKMTPKLDNGDVIAAKKVKINSHDNAFTLRKKLSKIGADLLIKTLPKWINNEITAIPQKKLAQIYNRNITYCTKKDLSNKNAQIKFDQIQNIFSAINKIRAFVGSGAWIKINYQNQEKRLKIFDAELYKDPCNFNKKNNQIILKKINKKLILCSRKGNLNLKSIQLQSKKKLPAKQYLYLNNSKVIE